MKAETADYLAKARTALADAHKIATLPLPHIAAREAYVAVFHAAEAYIFEQTDKVARSHRGVQIEFARLTRAEPRIGRDLVTFLTTAYQFKQRADYAIGAAAAPMTSAEAATALADAALKAPLIFRSHRTSRGRPVVPPASGRIGRPGAVGDAPACWG